MKKYLKIITMVMVCELVGVAGSLFTYSSIPTWYKTLQKPFFSPPNWIFAPVWTTLYLLMGISAGLIWIKGLNKKKNNEGWNYFIMQLFLNFAWSVIFFGFHQPFLALITICILWLLIFQTIKKFIVSSKLAAYLLIPYLCWVSFASLLNLAIVILNNN